MNENMGQIIKHLRKERNLTQEELAEQLNVSAQAISKWENGTSMPDISQVVLKLVPTPFFQETHKKMIKL